MNEGYIFFVGLWLIMILFMTGWLDFLWGGSLTKRHRTFIFLFLLVLFVTQNWAVTVGPDIQVYVSTGLFMLSYLVYFLYVDTSPYPIQAVCVALFLGILYAFAYQMFSTDPIMMILSPVYLVPIVFVILLLMTTHPLHYQWWMLAAGLWFGDVFHQFLLSRYVGEMIIASGHARDQLMIGITLLTTRYYVFSHAFHALNALYHSRKTKLSGQKTGWTKMGWFKIGWPKTRQRG